MATNSDEFSVVLDDLCARFLLNLPSSEFESFERLFFAIEEAHWFYEDFIRVENPSLPRLQLKAFAKHLFAHTPLLQPYRENVDNLISDFKSYKQEVPTCGAAMLDSSMNQVVLVKGWGSGARWSFPKGKVAKGETEVQAAIREVLEETGFDITNYVKENNYIDSMLGGRQNRIFIVPNVPLDAHFETKTRKEISKIEWVSLQSLPDISHKKEKLAAKYYSVIPYVDGLREWVKKEQNKVKGLSVANQEIVSQSLNGEHTRSNVNPTPQKQAARRRANGSSRQQKYNESTCTGFEKNGKSKDESTFGASSRAMTNEEREELFRIYVKEAEARAAEMGIKDIDWPVAVISSKDLEQPMPSKRQHPISTAPVEFPPTCSEARVRSEVSKARPKVAPITEILEAAPSAAQPKQHLKRRVPVQNAKCVTYQTRRQIFMKPMKKDPSVPKLPSKHPPKFNLVQPIRLLRRPSQITSKSPEVTSSVSDQYRVDQVLQDAVIRKKDRRGNPGVCVSETSGGEQSFSFDREPILECLT